MAIRHGYDHYRSSNVPLVERYIGTAYDKVRIVADNIAAVIVVADNIPNIDIVADNIDSVVLVGVNINDVITVADNIANINIVASEPLATNIGIVAGLEDDINALGPIANEIALVGDNIADVSLVASEMPDVKAVADVADILDDVLTETSQYNRKYYGALASEPTLRPNGEAVEEGDTYFNTVLNVMQVYDGNRWVYPGIDTVDIAADLANENIAKGAIFTRGMTVPFDGLGGIYIYNAARAGENNNQDIVNGWELQVAYGLKQDMERITGVKKLGNGTYYDGLVFNTYNQYVVEGDNIYVPKGTTPLPYTVSGGTVPSVDDNLENWIFSVSGGGGTVLESIESVTVATNGQLVITFVGTITNKAIHISGPNVDDAKLNAPTDFSYTTANTLTLTQSYPVGTVISAVTRTI